MESLVQFGYIENKCDHYESRSTFYGIMIVYILFQTLIYLSVIYLFWRKRNQFPITERSPYLVLTSVITCSISCLIIPFAILIYDFTKIPWINPYSFIMNKNSYRLTLFIRSFEVVMNAFILLPYMLRTFRITIVFNPKVTSRFLRRLFGSEGYLILLVFGFGVIFFLILFFLPECFSTYYFPFKATYMRECACFYSQQFFWRIFNMMEETIFLLMAFFTRNIVKEYGLCKETCIMTAFNLIYFNLAHLLPYLMPLNQICFGPMPLPFVLKDMRHLIVALLVTLYPLSMCETTHFPLTPSLTLESMEFFLTEERFFVVFYRFLTFLEAEKGKKNAPKLLRFYLDIKMISSQQDESTLNKAFFLYLSEEYFSHLNEFSDEIATIQELERTNTLCFQDLRELYFSVSRALNEHFVDFTKTRSFAKLRERLRGNDSINSRLYDFNILKKLE